jgi:hypothetical protein
MSTDDAALADDPGVQAALSVLLSQVVDDAALFPPGDAPMAEAVPAHLDHESGPDAGLIGRFLCPASRLAELRAVLPEDEVLMLGVIADSGLDGLAAALAVVDGDERFVVETVELRHPGADRLDELERLLPYGVEAYVEVAPADMRDLLPTLAGREMLRAKLRTGGLGAEAFPSPLDAAEFLVGCADLEVGLKCTAGLHHAVRYKDTDTGFTHHGFLNVLLAAALAADGRDVPEVRAALEIEDPQTLRAAVAALSVEDAAGARNLFHGFGSCSFAEPVEDLAKLGLLPAD